MLDRASKYPGYISASSYKRLRGHYTFLTIGSEDLEESLSRNLEIPYSGDGKMGVALHIRLGDLFDLGNGNPINANRISAALNKIFNRQHLAQVSVFTDSPKSC
jgi:hypothetical protein